MSPMAASDIHQITQAMRLKRFTMTITHCRINRPANSRGRTGRG